MPVLLARPPYIQLCQVLPGLWGGCSWLLGRPSSWLRCQWGLHQSAQWPKGCPFLCGSVRCLGSSSCSPFLVPSSSSHPADVFVPNWQAGRPAAFDVSVISTMQPLTISGAALSKGHALQIGEQRKMTAHLDECSSAGIEFIRQVVYTLGRWSARATEVISQLGRLMASRSGSSPSDSTRHLFQRLAICLWRGNAAMWSLPPPHPWMGLFDYLWLLSFLLFHYLYVIIILSLLLIL